MKQPVFEISLPHGFGCVCHLRTHPTYGDILGVDPKLRNAPLRDSVDLKLDRVIIFPLTASIDSGAVSARHIADRAAQNNLGTVFKFAVRDKNGRPIYWWLWDGNTIQVADTDQDLSKLPERRVHCLSEFLGNWL